MVQKRVGSGDTIPNSEKLRMVSSELLPAVLLRALEPVSNIDTSASGPGRLCRALDIDRRWNGHDLTTGELVLAEPADLAGHFEIEARPRVGVDYSGEWAHKPLRFCIAGNRFISRT